MDLYNYANGDPINHIDPDGRFARLVGGAISGLFEFAGMFTEHRYINPGFTIGANSFGVVDSFDDRNTAGRVISTGLNMIPVIGTVKSFIELSTGEDMVTGQRVSQGQAAFNVLASSLPAASMGVKAWASTATPLGTMGMPLSGGAGAFRPAANPWTGVKSLDRAPGNIKFLPWKRGDSIDKPMPDGSLATWDTVKSRYWKNRYEASKTSGEFSEANLSRIRRGKAPQDYNSRTGQWENRELHHVIPQRAGALIPQSISEN
jgi:hypothetical protein